LTTAPVPTVRSAIEVHYVAVPERFWNFRELPTFVLNDVFVDETLRAVHGRPVSFVYQRYSLNNYAGLRLAHRLGVPLILEYNGSEVWMSRHWGRPLLYDDLASRIELLNVNGADLVVVVSRAMRDELIARGVDGTRVLVNPNAVDPDRYSPAIDGGPVRQRYGLEGRTVLGFISTFQIWHGAVVLSNISIPALKTRQAKTTVEMPSGGSLAIAGLISDSTKQNVDGFPGLKDMPMLGTLFRSRDFIKSETELVVIVTPYMVRPTARQNLARADDGLAPASDLKANFLGHLNRIYGKTAAPPPGGLKGDYGFIVE
jgi:glycosyltransferase involved in cell wall biosynthesis